MASQDINPLEQLTEDLAEHYVAMVFRLTEHFAPVRPWWHAGLTPDQQLWRWITGPREEILTWLAAAGAAMGWTSMEEVLANVEQIFTSPAATDLIHPQIVAQIPVELLEMVQAAGPRDFGNHIRKMERMIEGRAAAFAALEESDQPMIPGPPDQPPPMPVELMPGTAGWPLYGMAPQGPQPVPGAPPV